MITIGFSSHRPEVLPEAERIMTNHDVIVLEEPPDPLFEKMLRGDISIEDYVEASEYEFPEFARASCELYRRIYSQGKAVLQIDPYMEHLRNLHELFAAGGSINDLSPESPARSVYDAEKSATAALLSFYKVSLSGSFEDVVKSVKNFARADARRIALRDQMRARSLAVEARRTLRLYIEAGYIHWTLQHYLRRLVYPRIRLRVRFLLQEQTRCRVGTKQIFGPGDILTLIFMFHPNANNPEIDLLAARSLIYVKLLQKVEMLPRENLYPHLEDETKAYLLTRNLNFDDCEKLWRLTRFKSAEETREIVINFIARSEATKQSLG
ncbi:MAG: hypothetical protein ACP5TY_09285 [Thermodesulforhabdaceae bacterium]|jgi:hypothetical protein